MQKQDHIFTNQLSTASSIHLSFNFHTVIRIIGTKEIFPLQNTHVHFSLFNRSNNEKSNHDHDTSTVPVPGTVPVDVRDRMNTSFYKNRNTEYSV